MSPLELALREARNSEDPRLSSDPLFTAFACDANRFLAELFRAGFEAGQRAAEHTEEKQ